MTGVLAVVIEEPHFVEVPERFRFSDENPLTLEPYARNKIGDLPPYIEDVITNVVGLSCAEWDALVDKGDVYEIVGPHRWYSLSVFLRSVRARTGREKTPKGRCGDCLGTLAQRDTDGSITGRSDGVVVCWCAV
jgi:hypothetical protein